MKAILLAAGLGTRLLPITEKIPKCLVEINGVSMLEFWLRKLNIKSLSPVVVNTHHFAQEVNNKINEINLTERVEIFHEKKLLGTAGTLRAIAEPTSETEILVVHCDNYSEIDIEEFLRAHRNRNEKCSISMAVFETSNVQMSGMVNMDEDNIVRDFIEKPLYSDLTQANAAIYAFDPRAVKEICEKFSNAEDIARDILPHFVGRIQAYRFEGFHMDMGILENLKTIKDIFQETK
jgi:mannose-1-phosphate guanylyltransferase